MHKLGWNYHDNGVSNNNNNNNSRMRRPFPTLPEKLTICCEFSAIIIIVNNSSGIISWLHNYHSPVRLAMCQLAVVLALKMKIAVFF